MNTSGLVQSKQATLLDGLGVSPLKWRACGCGLNRFVHEGMNHISNVMVHLKTRSGNVNILTCLLDVMFCYGNCRHPDKSTQCKSFKITILFLKI